MSCLGPKKSLSSPWRELTAQVAVCTDIPKSSVMPIGYPGQCDQMME